MADHGLSQRRACALAGADPKTVRRTPVPDSPDIRGRRRVLAGERRRVGYGRLGLPLERQGLLMNEKKPFRLYSDEGLPVR
jgi:putative transposase